jgi:hypothetical protein
VLKNSKIAGFENLANVACGRIQPLQDLPGLAKDEVRAAEQSLG